MIIIPISGGLGNQLFQYAFCIELGNYISKIYTTDYFIKRDYAHNGYELKDVFNIHLRTNFCIDLLMRLIRKMLIFKHWYIVKIMFFLLKLTGVHFYEENESFKLDFTVFAKRGRINILLGYWQSEYFFEKSMDKVRTVFCFNPTLLSLKSKEALYRITHSQSVSIHIRRGDYLNEKHKNTTGSVCTLKYYNLAIDLITDKVVNPFFYVFSDDIQWCKENINIPNVEFISWNNKEDSWQDMFLMSACQHNIIANSSFSWWGAWLNRNKDKIVIAPAGYIYLYNKNIHTVPSNWIKLEIGK